jgi:hypothetical protein
MQTPSPFSFEALSAAAGTPLRQEPTTDAILAVSLAQLNELEAVGRRVLLRDGYAGLARQASDLFAALHSLQSDGIRGAEQVDTGPLEDLCSLLQRLHADSRSEAA